MRFEVPQFIELEDKIFGPLTWKQFVYVLGGAGAVFILYVTLPFFFFVIIGGPIAAFAGALAFYKVNNRPFSNTLESMFGYITSSRLYLWRKSVKKVKKDEIHKPQTYLPPSSSSLSSMSRQLEINALQQKR